MLHPSCLAEGLSLPLYRGFLGLRDEIFAQLADRSQLRVIFVDLQLVLLLTLRVRTGDRNVARRKFCHDVIDVTLVMSGVIRAVLAQTA